MDIIFAGPNFRRMCDLHKYFKASFWNRRPYVPSGIYMSRDFTPRLLQRTVYGFVLANMTDKYQPLDSTVNKRIKSIIKNCYNSWYSQQVMDQLSTGVSPTEIKIEQHISIITPLHAGWIINAYEDLRSEVGIASILKGFANCAIEEAVDQAGELATGCDDPFEWRYWLLFYILSK